MRKWRTIVSSRRRKSAMCAGLFAVSALVFAPAATADTAENLRAAVAATRGSGCGQLHPDPLLDQAAAMINKTTDDWINFELRSQPEGDAMPLLKDLGYGGTKAAILSGAAATEGNVIKATVLQGYAKIPDCSYTAYGVDAVYNEKKALILTTVVLAG